MDTNTEPDELIDKHLQLNHWEIPPQRWHIGHTMPLGPNPSPGLCFPAFPRVLACKPTSLGATEPHTMILPSTHQETGPFGSAQNPQNGRNLHVP